MGVPSNNTNFTGTIPPELGDLVYLRSLDLSGYAGVSSPKLIRAVRRHPAGSWAGCGCCESWTWDTTSSLGAYRKELGRLVSLRTLDLRRNRLGGSIPQELDGLTELSTLRLDNNQLTGSIPPELGRLTKLRRLWLTENQLTGSIPPELTSHEAAGTVADGEPIDREGPIRSWAASPPWHGSTFQVTSSSACRRSWSTNMTWR